MIPSITPMDPIPGYICGLCGCQIIPVYELGRDGNPEDRAAYCSNNGCSESGRIKDFAIRSHGVRRIYVGDRIQIGKSKNWLVKTFSMNDALGSWIGQVVLIDQDNKTFIISLRDLAEEMNHNDVKVFSAYRGA